MNKKIGKIIVAFIIVLAGLLYSDRIISADSAGYTSAISLNMTGQWTEEYYLTESNPEHWYKIDIPADGRLELKVMSYVEGYYGTCYWLYDEDFKGALHQDDTGGGSLSQPKTKITNYILSKGIYYLKVWGDGTGKYKFCATYENYQVNDTSAVSYDQPLNYQLGTTIIGAITLNDTEDWYQLNISKDGNYVMKVTSNIDGYYGTCYCLFDQEMSNTLYDNYTSGGNLTTPKTSSVEYVLSKGIYYLKIWGNTGKYRFTLDELSPDNCTHEYEEKRIDPTYFKKGYTSYICKKCGYSYVGNYTEKLKLGVPAIDTYWTYGLEKGLKIQWSSVHDASGYELSYAAKKNFKVAKKRKISGYSNTSRTIKKLKKKKWYYVRIRAYIQSNGKIAYSSWSDKVKIQTR